MRPRSITLCRLGRILSLLLNTTPVKYLAMIRSLIAPLLLFFVASCGNKTQYQTSTATDDKPTATVQPDTSYRISTTHTPYRVTGFFNEDNILDTALLVRHTTTAKDALMIKYGGTNNSILLRNGKDVGVDFTDFNWVRQFEVIPKGTKIWNNVADGEIIGEDQVRESQKILLHTDAIFVHENEGGGGGILYLEKGVYVWVQQD